MNSLFNFKDEDDILCDDLLNSEHHINEFHSIVINSSYSVYALSGNWGSGKTCFIKMWQNFLDKENKKYVYIDAFKSDYETDPFIMLIKAFKDSFKRLNITDNKKLEVWLNAAKKVFSLRNFGKLGLNILIEKIIGIDAVKEILNETLNTAFNNLTDEKTLYGELHSALNDLLNENETIHIIIDELDRCRPDYALETLEKIKHLFNVKNVKYILVFNEKIMKSIINKKYGDEIDAGKYLQKNIQKIYFLNLTKRSLSEWYLKEVNDPKEKYNSSGMSSFLKSGILPLLKIAEKYELGLRDLQRLFSRLKHYKQDNEQLIVSIICFELLRVINENEFTTLINYYFTHGNFSFNVPSRQTYCDLLRQFFRNKDVELEFCDNCFYSVMKVF